MANWWESFQLRNKARMLEQTDPRVGGLADQRRVQLQQYAPVRQPGIIDLLANKIGGRGRTPMVQHGPAKLRPTPGEALIAANEGQRGTVPRPLENPLAAQAQKARAQYEAMTSPGAKLKAAANAQRGNMDAVRPPIPQPVRAPEQGFGLESLRDLIGPDSTFRAWMDKNVRPVGEGIIDLVGQAKDNMQENLYYGPRRERARRAALGGPEAVMPDVAALVNDAGQQYNADIAETVAKAKDNPGLPTTVEDQLKAARKMRAQRVKEGKRNKVADAKDLGQVLEAAVQDEDTYAALTEFGLALAAGKSGNIMQDLAQAGQATNQAMKALKAQRKKSALEERKVTADERRAGASEKSADAAMESAKAARISSEAALAKALMANNIPAKDAMKMAIDLHKENPSVFGMPLEQQLQLIHQTARGIRTPGAVRKAPGTAKKKD